MSDDQGRDKATERPAAESEAEPATFADRPHAGWSSQDQASYDTGDSGGWGGPGRGDPTGPIPRFHRPTHTGSSAPVADRSHGDDAHPQATYANTPGHGGGSYPHDPHHRHDADADADDDARGEGHAPAWHEETSEPVTASGPGALADLSFRDRATHAVAPAAYVLIVLYVFLDYVRSIYDYSSSAENFGPGALAGVLILLVVGFFKVVALVCVTRLGLELCLHAAELAGRGGERRD